MKAFSDPISVRFFLSTCPLPCACPGVVRVFKIPCLAWFSKGSASEIGTSIAMDRFRHPGLTNLTIEENWRDRFRVLRLRGFRFGCFRKVVNNIQNMSASPLDKW